MEEGQKHGEEFNKLQTYYQFLQEAAWMDEVITNFERERREVRRNLEEVELRISMTKDDLEVIGYHREDLQAGEQNEDTMYELEELEMHFENRQMDLENEQNMKEEMERRLAEM